MKKRRCIVYYDTPSFAIVYFVKNQYLTVATNKHYSNG